MDFRQKLTVKAVFVLCWMDFRQLLAVWVFWGASRSLLEAFWRPFAGFGALFGPFGDHPILVPRFHLPGDVGPFWGVLDPIWVSAGGKLPPVRLPAI